MRNEHTEPSTYLGLYQFETISRMPEHEQNMVRDLLDAVIVKESGWQVAIEQ